MSQLLKQVVMDLINENHAAAANSLHAYLTDKTRQIVGLSESAPINSYFDDPYVAKSFDVSDEAIEWLENIFDEYGDLIVKISTGKVSKQDLLTMEDTIWDNGYGEATEFTGSFSPDDADSLKHWAIVMAQTYINAARFYGVGGKYVAPDDKK